MGLGMRLGLEERGWKREVGGCLGRLKYLVVGVASLPLPRENPLGMGGVMAKRYGELVHDLWNGSSKSVTPLKFRVSH